MSRFYADLTRRDFLQFALAGSLGVSASGWLPQLARAAAGTETPKACILLWMAGGPSQIDTFDPKPDHENGGPTKPIQTSVPGLSISENLPLLARQAENLAIIRGLTTSEGDHGRGTQLMLTGYRPQGGPLDYPVLGSLLAKELYQEQSDLPSFVSVSSFRLGNLGSGFLGPQYAPLTVSGQSDDPQARANLSIENLSPPSGVSDDSMESRFRVLKYLQNGFDARHRSDSSQTHLSNYEKAMRMVRTQAHSAFKLEEETDELRDAYGRNRFGQGCLLARRLVERGVPFVEVALSQMPGGLAGWDTHANNFDSVATLCDVLDPAWSTLLTDLKDRGRLDSTLVVWMGEFGRTPQINDNAGRDHFPKAWSTVLAGAGTTGGQAVGDTGKDGMEVVDRPVTVAELYATICASLGIDPGKENYSPEGRPVAIVDGGASPVAEIVSA
jgi:hypothetical protein